MSYYIEIVKNHKGHLCVICQENKTVKIFTCLFIISTIIQNI